MDANEDDAGGSTLFYRGADKTLARPGMKQARNHVREVRDFNNIETRAVIKFPPPPPHAPGPRDFPPFSPKNLVFFLPVWAKDLSALLYCCCTRWFKYDRDRCRQIYTQISPVHI